MKISKIDPGKLKFRLLSVPGQYVPALLTCFVSLMCEPGPHGVEMWGYGG